MNRIISVIIPVYNVDAYLEKCLESVLSQSYSNLQVILIDDGSTDKSGTICDEFALKDSRVVVIHQKNSGAAAAKNAGLRVATGKYLSFVDSDDYLEPDAYAFMVGLLNTQQADVVQCTFNDVYVDKIAPCPKQGNQTDFTGTEYLEQFTKDWTCGLLWDKLYVRSIFDGIFFEEGHKIDDEFFTYQGIMKAHKIVRDEFITYNYRKRRSSVMRSSSSGHQILKDRIDYLSKRRVNVIASFPDLREAFDRHFVEMMVILSRDPLATKESNALIKQRLQGYFGEKNHTAVDFRLWPALLNIWFGCVKKADLNVESAADEQYFD